MEEKREENNKDVQMSQYQGSGAHQIGPVALNFKREVEKYCFHNSVFFTTPVIDDTTRGLTPLMIAALNGNLEIATIFIEAGADIHLARESDGLAPIHAAVLGGNGD